MAPESNAQVLFLRLALPGRPERNVGVFILDKPTGGLYFRLREDWDRIADRDEAELLSQLHADFERRIRELGEHAGERFLQALEDQLSNILRLTARSPVRASDLRSELDRLFEEHCATS